MENEQARLWIVDYHHRHGNDITVVFSNEEPNGEEVVGEYFEPGRDDEYIDVLGPYKIPPYVLVLTEGTSSFLLSALHSRILALEAEACRCVSLAISTTQIEGELDKARHLIDRIQSAGGHITTAS